MILTIGINSNSTAQLLLGPQAGLNIATLNNTGLTVESKPGLHAGFFLSIPFGKHFSIMPAALYSSKGFKYNYTTTTTTSQPDTSGGTVTSTVNFTADVNTTLGYLDIPVLLTLFSGEGRGLFIQAGPQLSFLISDKATVKTDATVSLNGGTAQPTTPTIGNSLQFNKTDVALIGGIGYKFPAFLILYARASTGFAKVQKGDFVKDSDAGHNFVIKAGLALTFGPK